MTLPRTENPKGKGSRRDKDLFLTLDNYGALDTFQIQRLHFWEWYDKDGNKLIMKYGKRKAQEVLLRLYQSGKLNRGRGEDCYYYYISDKAPGMVKHLIATNWVRLWHQKKIASWESLQSWSYEQDYKILRCDGFASIKNNMTGKFRFVFVEMDRGTNAFDKIEKYNKLFEQQDKYLAGRWWLKLTDTFPTVQIVTVHPARKNLIAGQIERANINGLNFTVKYLDSIKKEVME